MKETDREERVLDFLDRGGWKHSWNLPKDQNGNFDWMNPEATKRLRQEVDTARKQAQWLLTMAAEAEDFAGDWEARRKEEGLS